MPKANAHVSAKRLTREATKRPSGAVKRPASDGISIPVIGRRPWVVSAGLAALGLVPVSAAALAHLAASAADGSGDQLAPAVPAVVHAVSGTVYVVLGAFQFPTARRRRTRGWRRCAGRLLATLGPVAALSGLWLALSSAGPDFAHRGGAGIVPENTIEGFREATSLGPVVLELDVRISADGRVVVIHDKTVDGTTDGAGTVARKTLTELQRLDAGYRFTPVRGRVIRGEAKESESPR